jgi:hypothetical protein
MRRAMRGTCGSSPAPPFHPDPARHALRLRWREAGGEGGVARLRAPTRRAGRDSDGSAGPGPGPAPLRVERARGQMPSRPAPCGRWAARWASVPARPGPVGGSERVGPLCHATASAAGAAVGQSRRASMKRGGAGCRGQGESGSQRATAREEERGGRRGRRAQKKWISCAPVDSKDDFGEGALS